MLCPLKIWTTTPLSTVRSREQQVCFVSNYNAIFMFCACEICDTGFVMSRDYIFVGKVKIVAVVSEYWMEVWDGTCIA